MNQYVTFVKKLANSRSYEVRLLSRIVAADVRSNVSRNCSNITEEFGIDPWVDRSKKIKHEYKYYNVPETGRWRIPLLD